MGRKKKKIAEADNISPLKKKDWFVSLKDVQEGTAFAEEEGRFWVRQIRVRMGCLPCSRLDVYSGHTSKQQTSNVLHYGDA